MHLPMCSLLDLSMHPHMHPLRHPLRYCATQVATLARMDEMHAIGSVDALGNAQGALSMRGLGLGWSGGGAGAMGGGLVGAYDAEAKWLNAVLAANWAGWLATWLSNLVRARIGRIPVRIRVRLCVFERSLLSSSSSLSSPPPSRSTL